jgi:ankyrin repeat protein
VPYLYYKPQVQTAILRQLIAAGADLNQTNREGETALMWAAKSGNPELIEALLQAGANPRTHDKLGHDSAYHVQVWLSTRQNDTRRTRYEETLKLLHRAGI